MNDTYKKMIDFLFEARNPIKPMTPDWSDEIDKRLGKMAANPKLTFQNKSLAAQDQKERIFQKVAIPKHLKGTSRATLARMLYRYQANKNVHKDKEARLDKIATDRVN